MALNGQLHDFNLAEILQLIATQQKSGFLVLEGHREMVFVFDRGVLISTRDRRSEAPDPLEQFLRNYGFFTEAQWAHVGYIRQNSSLDLAEILISEELLSRDDLNVVLQNVARETAHKGMKMRRGRYNFTATKDSPPGVRWRIAMDVQGLLMEAARRVDEEGELARLLPSQDITFRQGPTPPPADALSPAGRRIIKLALGGRPLGRIIRLARIDSFTTREMLKNFLEAGWLEAVLPEQDGDAESNQRNRRRRKLPLLTLRHPLLSVVAATAVLGLGVFRWAPLGAGEMAQIGLAAPALANADAGPTAVAVSWLDANQQACRSLRLRQLRAEVNDAARHYQQIHGDYPETMDLLVKAGLLSRENWRLAERLGWRYDRLESGLAYRLVF
ncbi:MAG: DUF4388 domain-containing protein [Candidatus Krumholzibacteria bacterium]|jgi:hypothetical protein|nr:DUF4388 domain-containing protein [Candidatus Krumholzibacteria bacterium]